MNELELLTNPYFYIPLYAVVGLATSVGITVAYLRVKEEHQSRKKVSAIRQELSDELSQDRLIALYQELNATSRDRMSNRKNILQTYKLLEELLDPHIMREVFANCNPSRITQSAEFRLEILSPTFEKTRYHKLEEYAPLTR